MMSTIQIRHAVPACLAAVLLSSGLQAANRLFIEPQTVSVGQVGVSVPVRLDNEQVLYGFSLSIATDAAQLKLSGLDHQGAAIPTPEWSFGEILDGGARLSWGVVLDITEELDLGKVVPVGTGVHIANLKVEVTAQAAGVTTIEFQDRPGNPAAKNLLVTDQGEIVQPPEFQPLTSSAGAITISAGGLVLFRRGDVDGSGTLDLTDALRVLGYLFLGSGEPECLETADADDSGRIELTDALRILNYLFLGGLVLPPPGPPPLECGPDPEGSPDVTCQTYTC
ncbi:MAG TPA: dockerin type I repeat-containing protein [Planctomycetota bacterium]|nr:dockerin type I repeat-containing protein [Planctomycetota bacterium]